MSSTGERQKRKLSQYKVMNIGLWMHRRGNKELCMREI